MVYNIDDKIDFIKRSEHKSHTIRQIIRYDSGYLKDLFVNDERVVFTEECFNELRRLTKGHCDNWEKPKEKTSIVFDSLLHYGTPYLYDFNDNELIELNKKRLSQL